MHQGSMKNVVNVGGGQDPSDLSDCLIEWFPSRERFCLMKYASWAIPLIINALVVRLLKYLHFGEQCCQLYQTLFGLTVTVKHTMHCTAAPRELQSKNKVDFALSIMHGWRISRSIDSLCSTIFHLRGTKETKWDSGPHHWPDHVGSF